MEIYRYPAFKSSTTAVTICPLGDIQWAGDEEDLAYEHLSLHLKDCLARPNPLFVGMGDYIDFACVDLSARILTKTGWKSHDEVRVGDVVAAYNGANIVWTPLRAIHRYDSAPLVKMESKSFSARVTPSHTWWTRSWGLQTTESLQGRAASLVIAAKAVGGDSDLTPDEAWVIGWLITDGHIKWDDNFSVVQCKPQYVEELRSRLASITTREGVYANGAHVFNLQVDAVRAILWRAGITKSDMSELPALVLSLSCPAREAMLDAMLKAEGSFHASPGRKGNWRFSQSVKVNRVVVEVFINLCVMEGLRLGRSKPKNNGVWTPRILTRQTPCTYGMRFEPDGEGAVWCPETDFGTWVMRQGDQVCITGNSPSNRERLSDAKLYDTAKKVIADASRGLVDDLYRRLLKPTGGKWLGLTQGHHHHPVLIGKSKSNEDLTMDSDVYLAGLLKAKWLDEFGFVRLTWPGGGTFHVVAYHGKGSSVFPWGPLNQLWRLVPNFHADLLLMGHQTRKAVAETDRLLFPETGDKVRHMTVKIVGTGGWTKGYVNGKRTYISEAGLSPVALGQPMVHLRPRVVGGRWDAGMTVEM